MCVCVYMRVCECICVCVWVGGAITTTQLSLCAGSWGNVAEEGGECDMEMVEMCVCVCVCVWGGGGWEAHFRYCLK